MKHFYIISAAELHTADSALVKLGFTENVAVRLNQLKPGNHLELIILDACLLRNASSFEAFVHRAFKDNKVRGEWYKLSAKEIHLLYDQMDNAGLDCDCKPCHGYYQAQRKYRNHPNWQPDKDGWYEMKDHEKVFAS